VLDYGCGIGDFLRFRSNTIGVDINQHNVAYCARNGLTALLIESNHIPVEDGSFDGVVLDNVLEHIPPDCVDASISEIKRVLKQGGTLVVGVPGSKGFSADSDHKVFYAEQSLIQLFAKHGFVAREVFFMPVGWRKLEHILRQFCVYATFTSKTAS
jgi:SAM-dependent methyltransferase